MVRVELEIVGLTKRTFITRPRTNAFGDLITLWEFLSIDFRAKNEGFARLDNTTWPIPLRSLWPLPLPILFLECRRNRPLIYKCRTLRELSNVSHLFFYNTSSEYYWRTLLGYGVIFVST